GPGTAGPGGVGCAFSCFPSLNKESHAGGVAGESKANWPRAAAAGGREERVPRTLRTTPTRLAAGLGPEETGPGPPQRPFAPESLGPPFPAGIWRSDQGQTRGLPFLLYCTQFWRI